MSVSQIIDPATGKIFSSLVPASGGGVPTLQQVTSTVGGNTSNVAITLSALLTTTSIQPAVIIDSNDQPGLANEVLSKNGADEIVWSALPVQPIPTLAQVVNDRGLADNTVTTPVKIPDLIIGSICTIPGNTGTANQILTAGPSGGSLVWKDAGTGTWSDTAETNLNMNGFEINNAKLNSDTMGLESLGRLLPTAYTVPIVVQFSGNNLLIPPILGNAGVDGTGTVMQYTFPSGLFPFFPVYVPGPLILYYLKVTYTYNLSAGANTPPFVIPVRSYVTLGLELQPIYQSNSINFNTPAMSDMNAATFTDIFELNGNNNLYNGPVQVRLFLGGDGDGSAGSFNIYCTVTLEFCMRFQ